MIKSYGTLTVEGGTLELVEPYRYLTDNGTVNAFKYRAVSSFEEKSAVFFTRSAAEHWLKIISDRVQAFNYRTSSHA